MRTKLFICLVLIAAQPGEAEAGREDERCREKFFSKVMGVETPYYSADAACIPWLEEHQAEWVGKERARQAS